jgi:hypothetical protein
MGKTFILSCILFITACSAPDHSGEQSAEQISRLKTELETLRQQFKPGLGEIMTGIQQHHAKLWYAGTYQNWKLAEYEVGEIKEDLERAVTQVTDRPETAAIPIVYPALDSLSAAIQARQPEAFKQRFILLTNTCNTCHQNNHFEFNVVTIPTAPPVTNQDFRPKK